MYGQDEDAYSEWDDFNDPLDPNNGGGSNRRRVLIGLLVVIGVLAFGLFLLRRSQSEIPSLASDGLSLAGVQATAVPLIDAETADRQMQVAVSSHTSRQTLGLDCVAGTCNQRVVFDLIFLDEDMLHAIATQELIGQEITKVEPRVANFRQRLNANKQLPFLLISRIGRRTVPIRQRLEFGPIKDRFSLHNVRHEAYAPVDWDEHLFDRPMRLQPETENRGYLFFNRVDSSGAISVDLATDRSFRVEMQIDESVLPDPAALIWYFPLLSAGASQESFEASYPQEDIPLEDILEIIGILVQVAALL